MLSYDLLTQFKQLNEYRREQCVGYFLGGIGMDYEGWSDAEERIQYFPAKYMHESFDKSLTYARNLEMPIERLSLDHSYTSYCPVCDFARLHKTNTAGVCGDCFQRIKASGLTVESWLKRNAGMSVKSWLKSEPVSASMPYAPLPPDKFAEFKKFATGAVRGTSELPFHLITPHGLMALAATYGEGAAKYSPYNNLKGFPLSNLYNHALLHLLLFWWGDRTEDHLAHAFWNINQMILQQSEPDGRYEKLDDRPDYNITPDMAASYIDLMKSAIAKLNPVTSPQEVHKP